MFLTAVGPLEVVSILVMLVAPGGRVGEVAKMGAVPARGMVADDSLVLGWALAVLSFSFSCCKERPKACLI